MAIQDNNNGWVPPEVAKSQSTQGWVPPEVSKKKDLQEPALGGGVLASAPPFISQPTEPQGTPQQVEPQVISRPQQPTSPSWMTTGVPQKGDIPEISEFAQSFIPTGEPSPLMPEEQRISQYLQAPLEEKMKPLPQSKCRMCFKMKLVQCNLLI